MNIPVIQFDTTPLYLTDDQRSRLGFVRWCWQQGLPQFSEWRKAGDPQRRPFYCCDHCTAQGRRPSREPF